MLDRIKSLEVLVKVAATGSLSAAGRALGTSQTMVTKHIAGLEHRLGVRLFHRSTRSLSITDAGRIYLESAMRILAEVEAADSAVAADRVQPQGKIRLHAPLAFGAGQLATALTKFLNDYPLITVELGLNDRLVDLMEEGWDISIRIGDLADSDLMARRITRCRSLVCAAPSYIAAHGAPRTVAELARHNCIGHPSLPIMGGNRWGFGARGDIEAQAPGNLSSNNADAMRHAAVAGHGIIYQPSYIVADDVRAGRLAAIDLDHPNVEWGGIYAVYPPAQHPPAKVRAFIDFLVEQYGPEPPWDAGLF